MGCYLGDAEDPTPRHARELGKTGTGPVTSYAGSTQNMNNAATNPTIKTRPAGI